MTSLSWVLEMTCYGPSSQGAYGPVLGRGGARGGRHLSICLSFPLTNSPWGLAVCLALGWGGGWAKENHAEAMGQKNELVFLVIDLVSDLAPDILCAI